MKDVREQLDKALQYAVDSNYAFYDQVMNKRRELTKYTVCVFGAGKFFYDGYPYVKDFLHAKYLCDNNIQMVLKDKAFGLECITVDELCRIENVCVVIMLGAAAGSVKKQLDVLNIKNIHIGDLLVNMYNERYDGAWFIEQKGKIHSALDLFEDEESKRNYVEIICNRIAPQFRSRSFEEIKTEGEYFSTGLFQYSDTESYVDAGAYTGDSIDDFIKTMTEQKCGISNIYAFELEERYFNVLKENEKKWGGRACLYDKGLSNKEDAGERLTYLDKELKNKKVTLIKMDIEGYEWKALQGGAGTIRNYGPKLAVCLYHVLEDLWRIPLYVKELVPEYKLYLRHHSPIVWDSVLYATL